ncbi:MAG: helix-turn-helix domain-containing protein [Prevotella sp.]|nr:helix-turn-helix domain-containing protein [Prevotella sp.]
MKHLEPIDGQNYIMPDDQSVIIIDSIGVLPENEPYYSKDIFIAICTNGKAQLVYDGTPIIINKDEVFVGLPGSVLSDYLLSPSFNCKILTINPEEIITSNELHSKILNSSLHFKNNPIAKMTEGEKDMLFGYYNLIIQRIENSEHPFYKDIIHSLLNAFLLEIIGLLTHGVDEETSSTLHGEQIVTRFVQMVNENAGRERRVDYYADQLNITSKYLSTLVRSVLSRTPSDIIQMVTMKEIERLLHYSDKSIKQISNMMNFPNTSFFGKYFKQHAGMTPMTFRMKNRKNPFST